MILKINGNVKPYYIQTLSMIFFPGVKFPEDEEETPDTLKATLDMTESEDEDGRGHDKPRGKVMHRT